MMTLYYLSVLSIASAIGGRLLLCGFHKFKTHDHWWAT